MIGCSMAKWAGRTSPLAAAVSGHMIGACPWGDLESGLVDRMRSTECRDGALDRGESNMKNVLN